MIKRIVAATALLVGATLLSSPAHAAEPVANPYAPKTFVIGDSITALGYEELRARQPGWFIFGIGGMNVEKSPEMVAHFLKWQPKPDMVVLALGTNASTTWTKDKLRATLALLPATTRVALVTTYRDPVKFHRDYWYEGSRAYFQGTYTTWMQEMVAERPHTCVVPWRGWIYRNQARLTDGVHPDQAGQTAWASLVDTYSARCV